MSTEPIVCTVRLTETQALALASLLDDYIDAHTDHGYDPPYNGDDGLGGITFSWHDPR